MTATSDFWVNFWKDHGKSTVDCDEQTRVLRTLNKQPIEKELWEDTLTLMAEHVKPVPDDVVLELCCGNGLISRYFSKICKTVVCVDVSADLVTSIDTKEHTNIETIVADIRDLSFPDSTFSKIIIYAGIQYLSPAETTTLFANVYDWLKPAGIFFLGDIPNYNNIWDFYNSTDREAVYFHNLQREEPLVGTWFQPEFFEKLGSYAGFADSVYIPQHEDMIYSHFRFDFKLRK